MERVFKNWKTSLIGAIILGGLCFKAFTVGFSISDALLGLISAGFIVAKDKKKWN